MSEILDCLCKMLGGDDYINFKFAIGMLGGVYCADIVKEIINILDILIAILSGVDFGNLVFS